ncbi:hypothetical protein [Mesoterricola sediminis]|uniref:Uncharacterized protein n=1 Tax=Mesoterricola sediminis TaxID=2927980 RepID=A0AA48GVJ1_9BACT|nr:hypothetical protein [Mesoterricola sediminis]BDU78402.1 hypothetical protein METESE_33600 [Mesoterricola sediminis]
MSAPLSQTSAPDRPASPARRWLCVLLLVVLGTFLAAAGRDHCHDGGHQASAPHLLCVDDCAPAVIPAAPAPPPRDPQPEAPFTEAAPAAVRSLDLEPEKAPPRA